MKRSFSLLALFALLGALAVSQVATAAAFPARPATFANPTLRDAAAEPEEEFEAEEVEFEFEDCGSAAEPEFEFEDEAEEEEFEEEELEEDSATALPPRPRRRVPPSCPPRRQVRQAESTSHPAANQVRLTVRYQTYSPTPVTVGLKLKDHKGAIAIEHATKHLGGKGVLRLTTTLGAAVMDRAAVASEFDVSLRAPETPGYCAAALEQRLLSAKHTSARAPRVYAN